MGRFEGLRDSARVYQHTTIGDKFQTQLIGWSYIEQLVANFISISAFTSPVDEYIYAYQLFFHRWLLRYIHLNRHILVIANSRQFFRFFTQTLNYCIGKFFGTYAFLAAIGTVNIPGMDAILERTQPGVLNQFCFIGSAHLHQHHGGTIEQTRRICQILTGNVRRWTMNGFKHGMLHTNVGRTCHAYRTGNLGCNVWNHITIQVERYYYIKRLRTSCYHCWPNVNDPVIGFNVGVLQFHLVEDSVEHTIRMLHDVILGHTSHFIATVSSSIFKGVTNNFFTARIRNQFQCLNYLTGLLVLNTGIQIFFIFPYNHHIHQGKVRRHIRRICPEGAHIWI